MYFDDDPIEQFKRMHARDVMRLETGHIDEAETNELVGAHLYARFKETLVFNLIALTAIAALIAVGLYIMG